VADEADIRALIVSAPDVLALVPAARVWDERVPASVGAPVPLPFIIITVVDEVPQNTVSDGVAVGEYRLQFDLYGTTKNQVRSLLSAVRQAVQSAGSELFTRSVGTEDPGTRRLVSDWRFWLQR